MFIPRIKKVGPLFISSRYKDTKDPCVVFDGATWHIYGSGGSVRDEKWRILHATSPHIEGPWEEQDSVVLNGVSGDRVAAPAVLYDEEEKMFQMFIQTDFLSVGAPIVYLSSRDGRTFNRKGIALDPIPHTSEAGLYDPHISILHDKKYLVYSATPLIQNFGTHFVSRPDIHLAVSESNTWDGPWRRLGEILNHKDIEWHHNQHDHPHYEWGIEGPQLLELGENITLLNATCFLPGGRFGTRQRVLFAVSKNVEGPYHSLGPVLSESLEDWESGENGHATVIIHKNTLYLFYQARSAREVNDVAANNWQYGLASFDLGFLQKFLDSPKLG